MNTQTKVTKAEVLALARKRWPKCEIEDRGAARAVKPEARAAARERTKAIFARETEITAELKASAVGNFSALVKAARFAVDVDGDDPSLPELRKQVEQAERYLALREEQSALFHEKKQQQGISLAPERFRVLTLNTTISGFPMREVRAEADTLEGLAEKIANAKY